LSCPPLQSLFGPPWPRPHDCRRIPRVRVRQAADASGPPIGLGYKPWGERSVLPGSKHPERDTPGARFLTARGAVTGTTLEAVTRHHIDPGHSLNRVETFMPGGGIAP
jgi:hypothetical protein